MTESEARSGLLRGMAVALIPACLFWAGVGMAVAWLGVL